MNVFKSWILRMLRNALQSQAVREVIWQEGRDILCRPPAAMELPQYLPPPPQYRQAPTRDDPPASEGVPVFITARFRAGSTFLWQLFRNTRGITAYYEPLNESRWFDPSGRHAVDKTHLGVVDYRREYEGMADLSAVFRTEWAFHHLYMDGRSHDQGLYRYISALIGRSTGRPVLQFNRVDFRLPWLKAHFPTARLVHLYRDPREQWMSAVAKAGVPVPPGVRGPVDSHVDLFYTLEWARDLRWLFPFLDPQQASHPYELHYYLWRLSYLFGRQWADYSLAYEDLVTDLEATLGKLYRFLAIEAPIAGDMLALNKGEVRRRSQEYAAPEWFAGIEQRCEEVLKAFLMPPDAGQGHVDG